MADETADNLREMAEHRGLKLVKSRRRKPGTGDYGKFGLTDAQGNPLLGVGEDGLTASASEIKDYLRAGAASTWQQSAEITPDRASRGSDRRPAVSVAEKPALRSRARDAVPARRAKRSSGHPVDLPSENIEKASASTSNRKPAPAPTAEVRRPAPSGAPVAQADKSEPEKVQPSLVLRLAKPADAGAIAELLGQLNGIAVSDDDVKRDLAALRKAGAGCHLAELGRLAGCIGWAVVPTLHRGPVGRITVLVVDEVHRRKGIGTLLLREAETSLAKKGCAVIEAMSDIEIKNAHNFFRTARFDQTSYRFARKVEP